MYKLLACLVAVAAISFAAEESHAQFYRGSGFSSGFGGVGFNSFNRGFGGSGFNRGGISINLGGGGFNRGFYGGGRSFYGGGRGCGY